MAQRPGKKREPDVAERAVGTGIGGAAGVVVGAALGVPWLGAPIGAWIGHKVTEELARNGKL